MEVFDGDGVVAARLTSPAACQTWADLLRNGGERFGGLLGETNRCLGAPYPSGVQAPRIWRISPAPGDGRLPPPIRCRQRRVRAGVLGRHRFIVHRDGRGADTTAVFCCSGRVDQESAWQKRSKPDGRNAVWGTARGLEGGEGLAEPTSTESTSRSSDRIGGRSRCFTNHHESCGWGYAETILPPSASPWLEAAPGWRVRISAKGHGR